MSALLLLFRLNTRGTIRRMWSTCKTPEGVVRAVFAVGFVSLLFVPLVAAIFNASDPLPDQIVASARYALDNFLPLFIAIMFFLALLSPKGSESLNFQPAEIDFLFSAPFSRRQLLIYKLIGVVTSTLAICLVLVCFFSAVFVFVDGNLFAAFVRGYLAAVFAVLLFRLLFIWSGLVRQSIAIRMLTPLRKAIACCMALVAFIALSTVWKKLDLDIFHDEAQIIATAKTIVETNAFQYGVAPFRAFSNLILCESLSESVLWATLCIAANLLVVFLILKTDEDFLETEINNSQARLEVARKTANMESCLVPSGDLRALPMLPFMGGIGPIAWRQLQTFFRMKRVLIVTTLVLLLMYLVVIFSSRGLDSTTNRFSTGALVLVMLTFMIATSMPMGFHTDVQKMNIFKSLPFSTSCIAAGQLLGPILVLLIIQYTCILFFLFTALDQWLLWIVAAAYAPLVSTILLSIFNVVSLLYPCQPGDGVLIQLENIGRVLVYLFLMAIAWSIIAAMLAAAGASVYFLTDSVAVVVVVCWFVLLLSSVSGVWATGWTFDRFDVSKHRV